MISPIRFSQHYLLGKSQWELDFVDIPLNTDICLFVDPYAISIQNDNFSNECNDMIITYFQMLLDAIRSNNSRLVSRLLSNLHEPNDTHLGFSQGASNGREVGLSQAKNLYNAFIESEAAKTGFLRDISDCALLIHGINRDKISDITINIIRQNLIKYTKAQCLLHKIPTKSINTGKFLDFEDMKWKSQYEDLPYYQDNRIILTPKSIVRQSPEIDAGRYYHKFILQYLQAEHCKAGDALAHVLKNGTLKVYKKDLKNRYPLNHEFIYEFSKQHPEIMERYKESVKNQFKTLSNEQIELQQQEKIDVNIQKMIEDLPNIEFGNKKAGSFHQFIIGAFSAICGDRIRRPQKEVEINDGRKRIDLVYDNSNIKGFFSELSVLHKIKCPYIFIECKNYEKDINNPELDQLTGRLSEKRGMFGIIICRRIENKDRIIAKCKDALNDKHHYIIVLDDTDILCLLKLRMENKEREIDDYFRGLLQKVVM